MANDHVKTVAETLIAQLEQGTAPWTRPWTPGERFAPYNLTTGKEYRGANALWLMAVAQIKGYGDARWLTYKQAVSIGAQVRKGEKSVEVQYWKFEGEELVEGPDGQMKRELVRYQPPRVFSAKVFNAAQIDGLPPPPLRPVLPEWERHERAEAIMRNVGAAIRHLPGDAAYYDRIKDRITLPERSQFPDADSYYETALHETAHATGHASRLDRDMAHPFGSEKYAKEELHAEIATLMLGEQLGVGHNPQRCASYVASWIEALQKDPREIFRAASDAQKIVEYMRSQERSLEQNAETQPDAPEQETLVRAPVLIPSESELLRDSSERTYLAVPFKEKDEAKALGARWDREAKSWYAPPGADLAPFKPWLHEHADFRTIGHDADPRQAFAQALREAGLEFNGFPEMDGRLHRVRTADDKRGEKSGWYVGHADGCPAGKFGDWRQGTEQLWKHQRPAAALGATDRARLNAENAQRRQERERREEAAHEAAVAGMAARLEKARPAPADHPYLARKGVESHGVFVEGGELLVPVRELDGRLRGVQSIGPDGAKKFVSGSRIAGSCHLIGEPDKNNTVLIAEGYATGATLREKTGLPVAIAFNAGNLEAVARAVRERWPDKRIVIAGDDDRHNKTNVGREKAEAAAKAVGGVALFPKFGADEPGADWNDLGQAKSKAEVLKQVQEGLALAERQVVAANFKASRENEPEQTVSVTQSRGCGR